MNIIELVKLLTPVSRPEEIDPNKEYKILGVKWYAKGVFIKSVLRGKDIKAKKVYKVKTGDFIYNRLFAWKGSFALITDEFDECFVSNEFPLFTINTNLIIPEIILYYFSGENVWAEIEQLSKGVSGISRKRFKEEKLLKMMFPLPDDISQRKLSDFMKLSEELEQKISMLKRDRDNIIQAVLQETFSPN